MSLERSWLQKVGHNSYTYCDFFRLIVMIQCTQSSRLPLELLERIAITSGSLTLACAIRSRFAIARILELHSTRREQLLDPLSLLWMLSLPNVDSGHVKWDVIGKDALQWPKCWQDKLIRHEKVDWGFNSVLEFGYQRGFWKAAMIEQYTVESWLYFFCHSATNYDERLAFARTHFTW